MKMIEEALDKTLDIEKKLDMVVNMFNLIFPSYLVEYSIISESFFCPEIRFEINNFFRIAISENIAKDMDVYKILNFLCHKFIDLRLMSINS